MDNEEKPAHLPDAPRLVRPSDLLKLGLTNPEQPALFPFLQRPLRFVIKLHRATNLHTDYRFEVFETLFSLVSWTHPSVDPQRPTRLREMPDHDPTYLMGERRIPDGSYGAGPMVVWDFGNYFPTFPYDGLPSVAVLTALIEGRLDFRFEGRRLRGTFRLEIADRGWRLIKMEDEFASVSPVEWDDLSVVTGRSLDDIEREYQATIRRLRG